MRSDEHSSRHWYLISYDIRSQKRWRQAYKKLRGSGERVQYSLFRCHLNRTELESLRWELECVVEDEDDLLVIHLCPHCAASVEVRGENQDWDQPRPRFTIL